MWFYQNVPQVSDKLNRPDEHDACYIPRDIHVTGDIDIHEMAWEQDETTDQAEYNQLWIVSTKFSCLCTLDHKHNFIPRWRPPFVSALYLEDRCHLNGLGMRAGQPKYVTMLGETDTPVPPATAPFAPATTQAQSRHQASAARSSGVHRRG